MAGWYERSERQTRILIVAEDRFPVERLIGRLTEDGHAVEVAEGLADALERLERLPRDLVLLGPSPAGASFERALAALSSIPSAPAVVVAGGPDNLGVASWALRAGASAYLTEADLEGPRLLAAVAEVEAHRRRLLRLADENRQITDRMESIERLFEAVSEPELSARQRIAEILRLGCRLFDQRIGIVSSISGSRYKVLQVEAPEEFGLEAGQEFDLGLTYCSITLAHSEPVMIDHVGQSEWKTHPCYGERGLESFIGARVDVGGNEAGTLNFSSPVPRETPFRGADRDLMVMMSTWVSTILVRERLDATLRESERLYRDLVENSSDLICTHDLEGRILSANRTLVESFGQGDDSELVGHNLAEFLSPSVRDELAGYLEAVRTRGRVRGYMRVFDRDGGERILEYHNSLRREGVDEPVVRATARDVTELKRAEAELRHSEQMLRVFVKHTPAAVAMFDCEMRYLAVSDRWRADYRLGAVELLGRSHYEVFPEIAEHWREVHRRCLDGGVEQADEDPFPRSDGHLDWVRWEVRPWYTTRGEIGGLLMFTEVFTDRKRVEDALRYLATHDHLTGLPNRTAFVDRLDRSLQRAAKSPDYGFTLFSLDLDDFKKVNDAWGHGVGDELIQRVAERLRLQLRPKDALARIAGDEFVGLLEDTHSPVEVAAAAERLLEQFHNPFELEGPRVRLEASLGLVLSTEGGSAEELLGLADSAMVAAKKLGKGGWHLYGHDKGRWAEGADGTVKAVPSSGA